MQIHMVKDIKIINYDYPLPDNRIPRHPLRQRDACRLIVSGHDASISHALFNDLTSILSESAPLLVCNDTKVINARISFKKPTGAIIEVFLLEPVSPHDYVLMFQAKRECRWKCMVGNLKRWKDASLQIQLDVDGEPVILSAEKTDVIDGNTREIIFRWNSNHSFSTIIEKAGFIPIPPYLKRDAEEIDRDDYQTVFSKFKGSVAAPTAGLHFTDELLDNLRTAGVDIAQVTLHVGAGTFLPVKSEKIGDHPMHTEVFSVSRNLILNIISALQNNREIIAVGTTTVRTLESLPYLGRALSKGEKPEVTQWEAYDEESDSLNTISVLNEILKYMDAAQVDSITASTSIMIAPGFRWRIVNRLITNFHQPQSTLLLLVDSFLNSPGQWRRIYNEALMGDYRFLSYGDACLFSPVCRPAFPVLPGSKSIAARTLIASLSAAGEPLILNLPDCDDTHRLADAVEVIRNAKGPVSINVGNGGTTLRFLLATLASMPEIDATLSVESQLANRPVSPLINALRESGADIEEVTGGDSAAYHIKGKKLNGGEIFLDAGVSSQFISAVLLAAPLWQHGATVHLTGMPVSFSYIEMTLSIMEQLSIKAELNEERDKIKIRPGRYTFDGPFMIEPDWSAAGYFFAEEFLRAVESGNKPDFESLRKKMHLSAADESLQGEAAIQSALEKIYSAPGHDMLEINCSDFPDSVPALAVAAAVAGKSFRLTGLRNLRHKESDRLSVIAQELLKLGLTVTVGSDGSISYNSTEPDRMLRSTPNGEIVHIDPHGDHRMAMAFAPLLSRMNIVIDNPEVVGKSFPSFFKVFPHPQL